MFSLLTTIFSLILLQNVSTRGKFYVCYFEGEDNNYHYYPIGCEVSSPALLCFFFFIGAITIILITFLKLAKICKTFVSVKDCTAYCNLIFNYFENTNLGFCLPSLKQRLGSSLPYRFLGYPGN